MKSWFAACLTPVVIMSALPLTARADICAYSEVPVLLDGVDFCYPEFTLTDSTIESAVNAHLASGVQKLFADWYQWPEGSYAEGGAARVAVDEEQNVLSVLMSAYIDIAGAAHPYTVLYSENYSLDDGSPLRPIDFLDAEQLTALIRSREVARLPESDAELFSEQLDYLSTMPGKSLERAVGASSVMWLPGETLLVILPVPHALGDYALLSVSKERLIQ